MKIEVKHTVLGTHRWTACPHKEVDFLRNEHLHDFTIRASCNVTHTDRQVEFILVRIRIIEYFEMNHARKDSIYRFGELSCEALSKRIEDHLKRAFHKNFKVNVSEDETYRGGDW
jgi:hypothetical protein